MRLRLWCVWTGWMLTVHPAAQHPSAGEEGGVQAGWRRLRADTATPLRPDVRRGAGERLGGRRTPLSGPRVCGARCCVGWTLSPKTKRCTKPRCHPRCRNNAVCRQINRCVCRRGFHGYRCEVSTAMLTSIHPGSVPKLNLESGVKAEDVEAKLEEKQGVSKEFLMQDENQASPKSPAQVGRGRVERTGEERPEFNDLQTRSGHTKDPEEGAAGAKTGGTPEPHEPSGSQTQTKSPNLESPSWAETEGKVSLDSKESLETGDRSLTLQSGSGSEGMERLATAKIHNLESNSGSRVEERLNLEFSSSPRGEKSVDVVETGEKKNWEEDRTETDEQKKKKKTGGAKKNSLSLREAQSVLLRKTLSRGGRGDKMATLLMKHIEKERKKLLAVSSSSNSSSSSSSSVKTSVKTFHTQKGQYTVHFTAPTGQ